MILKHVTEGIPATPLSVEAFIKNGLSAEAIDTRFILLSVGIFIVSLLVSRLIKK